MPNTAALIAQNKTLLRSRKGIGIKSLSPFQRHSDVIISFVVAIQGGRPMRMIF